jgi:hypothetical protein
MTSDPERHPTSSYYYQLTNVAAGPGLSLAVDVDDTTSGGGRGLAMTTSDDADPTQLFRIVPVGRTGAVKLQVAWLGGAFSLDVVDTGRTTIPHLALTGRGSGQRWTLRPAGRATGIYRLFNDRTGPQAFLSAGRGDDGRLIFGRGGRATGWIFTRVRVTDELERLAQRFRPYLKFSANGDTPERYRLTTWQH